MSPSLPDWNPPYVIVTIVAFIVVLGVLVLIHELGHFLTARLFGVRVEEFGFGFPPRVYPRRTVAERLKAEGKTVYSLNALPLGGFVRLAGENGVVIPGTPGTPGTPGAGPDASRLTLSGRAAAADDPHAFANRPAWQRAIVLAAGPFNNMVLAMLLVFFIYAVIGLPHTGVAVVGVALDSPAAQTRIAPGDVIQRVAGQVPQDPTDVHDLLGAHQGRPVTLELLHNGRPYTVSLVPRLSYPCDQGPIGVMTNPINQRYVPAGVGRAGDVALRVPVTVGQGIIGVLGQLVSGSTPQTCSYPTRYVTFGGVVTSALGVGTAPGAVREDPCLRTSGSSSGFAGPIGIVRQVGCEANSIPTQGWVPLLTLVALLSADLAIVNLLPIPALDGGRLLFVLISVLARRRIRPEVEGMAHALGMAALLTLILFVSWNDLLNLIHNRPVF